jgi:hypothetical protein
MGRSTNINSPVAPAVVPPIQVASVTVLSAIAAKTATFNSTGVDLLTTTGSENAQVLLETGVVSGTTPTMDVTVQESDDNSTWANVTLASDSDAYAQVTASNNVQRFKFKRTKRYLRIAVTIAGTTPSFTMGALLLR